MEAVAQNIEQLVDGFLSAITKQGIDWEYKPNPDKWSKKEIIGHLIDSATNNLHRFVRCTYEQEFKLIYAQNEWVIAQNYQHSDINDLLALWRLLNQRIAAVLRFYPQQKLQNTCDTGKQEVNLHTVEFLANDYVAHLSHHLKQIAI